MERKRPVFGGVSSLLAILTLMIPFVVAAVVLFSVGGPEPQNQGWGWLDRIFAGAALAGIAAGLTGLVGAICGAISVLRGERRPWLGVVGLAVNGSVVLLFLCNYLNSFLNPA